MIWNGVLIRIYGWVASSGYACCDSVIIKGAVCDTIAIGVFSIRLNHIIDAVVIRIKVNTVWAVITICIQ